MAKKSFQTAPKPANKPSPDAISAYESNGIGKDTQTQKTENSVSLPKLKLKRLSIDLSPETHKRFKKMCLVHDLSMSEEVSLFIEKRTQELEKDAI